MSGGLSTVSRRYNEKFVWFVKGPGNVNDQTLWGSVEVINEGVKKNFIEEFLLRDW